MVSDYNKKLSVELSTYPLMFCAVIYVGDPSRHEIKVNNGTVTLIKYKGKRYGVTNFHVIQAFRDRIRVESRIQVYINNVVIDLRKDIIGESPENDLCLLNLDKYSESDFKSVGADKVTFAEIYSFGSNDLKVGKFVVLGGYPGVWRARPKSDELVFGALCSGGTEISDVTERNIRCEIDIEKCIINFGKKEEFPENLGGMSGGPVFLFNITSSGISLFDLAGIIYEQMPIGNSILIRPLKFLRELFFDSVDDI